MQNLPVMQSFEPSYDLDENVPDLFFFDIGFTFLIVANFLKHITVVGIFHHKAGSNIIVKKS